MLYLLFKAFFHFNKYFFCITNILVCIFECLNCTHMEEFRLYFGDSVEALIYKNQTLVIAVIPVCIDQNP